MIMTPSDDLTKHRGFSRVFQPGRLTFGFIAPLETYPDTPAPTMRDHAAMAARADAAGFSILWLRDVPFYDPGFGDLGQVLEPMAYAGWLANATRSIAIGTAGIVAPLRDPIITAKQATTLDHLTDNRFLLGLASGDRPIEYPAFGIDYETRGDRYREFRDVVRSVTDSAFPSHATQQYGVLEGRLDLLPRPINRLPLVAIGRAGQSLEWIAENMDAFIWHQGEMDRLPSILGRWAQAVGDRGFKPYGYAAFFELDPDPDAPLRTGRGLTAGRKALIDLWRRQQDLGVSHVALNIKMSRRPASELLDELGEHVLPHFPAL
jgi:luciferase-type oxidoreductase